MVRTLNTSDVRLVMKYEIDSITTNDDKGKVSVIEGNKKPYSCDVVTLRQLMTERNV